MTLRFENSASRLYVKQPLRITRKNLFYHSIAQLSLALQTVPQLVLAKRVAMRKIRRRDQKIVCNFSDNVRQIVIEHAA